MDGWGRTGLLVCFHRRAFTVNSMSRKKLSSYHGGFLLHDLSDLRLAAISAVSGERAVTVVELVIFQHVSALSVTPATGRNASSWTRTAEVCLACT